MLRESSAEDGSESAGAVADAALAWLRDCQAPDVDVSALICASVCVTRRVECVT